MRKLKVLIEGNVPDSVRLVEVVTTVPVATLIPALMKAMQLPETDLFGKQLSYQLRWARDGQFIPMDVTLGEAGVTLGARLVLESFENDSEAFFSPSAQQQGGQTMLNANANGDVHTAVTLVEPAQFSEFPYMQDDQYLAYLESRNTSGASGSARKGRPSSIRKQKQGPSRRTFLLAAGAICGVAGIGLVYALDRSPIENEIKNLLVKKPVPTVAQPKLVSHVQRSSKPVQPDTARLQFTFTKHQNIVRSVAWSPDGKLLASCADDKHAFLWKMDGTTQLDLLHDGGVKALAWSPDGQRIVTGANNEVSFFNVQNGTRLAHSIHRHTQMVTSLAWTARNAMQVVSGGADKQAFVWDTRAYRSLTRYQQHTAAIDVVSWTADGRVIASSADDGMVRIWNAANGKDVHGYYQDTMRPMRAMAFAPGGAQLAVGGDDGVVRIWNALTCRNDGQRCTDEPQRISVAQAAIRALAWSPDGRLLAVGSNDGTFSIWNPARSQQALISIKQNNIVRSLAWSPDSNYLASAFGNSVSIWNIKP